MSHTRALTFHRWRVSVSRRLGLDANPLRRGTDRAEAWIRIGLVVVFIVAAPVTAVLVGRWADAATTGAARAHAAAVHPVQATVLRTVPDAAPDPSRGAVGWVPARWTGPGGSKRTGEVQAPLGTPGGAKVQIWVDRSGRLSDPPLTQGQVLSRVITAVALTPVAIALLLGFILGLTHRIVDRRRLLAWESAWSAVEPLWTRRTR